PGLARLAGAGRIAHASGPAPPIGPLPRTGGGAPGGTGRRFPPSRRARRRRPAPPADAAPAAPRAAARPAMACPMPAAAGMSGVREPVGDSRAGTRSPARASRAARPNRGDQPPLRRLPAAADRPMARTARWPLGARSWPTGYPTNEAPNERAIDRRQRGSYARIGHALACDNVIRWRWASPDEDHRAPRAPTAPMTRLRPAAGLLMLALLAGSLINEPRVSRGARPNATAAADFLAQRDGGGAADYRVIYERGVRGP